MFDILTDPIVLIILIVAVILFIAVAIGSYRHVHKTGFKPTFRKLSDGSVQLECTGFGGLQTTRTKRFYEKYKLGMELIYENKRYKIVEFKELIDPSLLQEDRKIVAYLEEV
ncbi:hypothetical protein A9G11_09690 [Gilliamella sp. wkB108]|uniref:hypothetical protein n=1 Tax=Gilliamella sp. wkB108 TaxID=3120256 RepID=UPI00080DFECB|nr:hypothetical protein [Gilliamella apicola]OCG20956.1 hypothetical protein A9G11_09690 [Gilliamella apicola]